MNDKVDLDDIISLATAITHLTTAIITLQIAKENTKKKNPSKKTSSKKKKRK